MENALLIITKFIILAMKIINISVVAGVIFIGVSRRLQDDIINFTPVS